jgi:hypothetical protein
LLTQVQKAIAEAIVQHDTLDAQQSISIPPSRSESSPQSSTASSVPDNRTIL